MTDREMFCILCESDYYSCPYHHPLEALLPVGNLLTKNLNGRNIGELGKLTVIHNILPTYEHFLSNLVW